MTTSWTTRASMPAATSYVSSSTVTSTCWAVPSASTDSYTHLAPGCSGQNLLVTSTVKSAGSRVTFSLPCGRAGELLPASVVPEELPHPLSERVPTAARARARPRHSARARTGGLRVGRRADDGEAPVQLDVDLAAVGPGHLDLVVALLVAHFGTRDLAAAGLGERGIAGLLQGRPGDGDVRAFGGVGRAARGRDACAGGHDGRGTGDDGDLLVDPHGNPPRICW